jgi:CheY-specific phosphatase CheX
MARDLLGEFSNMLLGRVKNRLLPHGVAVVVSTPRTLLDRDVVEQVSAPEGEASVCLHFTAECGRLAVRLDLSPEPGFAWTEVELEVPAEGEVLFF